MEWSVRTRSIGKDRTKYVQGLSAVSHGSHRVSEPFKGGPAPLDEHILIIDKGSFSVPPEV